ncbi:MAG: manganese efflux pump MntP family protein [Parabacteroides sp.]|nr:manganese efflux pump MntP family protein [bacterium]MDY4101864.1 manganese efflux pump MntP family protein [Parabacteroides sp.]
MSFVEIVLLAVGLSMDSLAVSVTGGALLCTCRWTQVVRIAAVLAFFQATFTLLGYVGGYGFQHYIQAFDHWIAFILLLYLGGRMIYESTQEEDEEHAGDFLKWRTLCTLGVATSIDALAVGISLALLQEPLVRLIATVGVVTFLFAASGVLFGNRFGRKVDLKLDLIGGFILIAIGLKILIEHLFFA